MYGVISAYSTDKGFDWPDTAVDTTVLLAYSMSLTLIWTVNYSGYKTFYLPDKLQKQHLSNLTHKTKKQNMTFQFSLKMCLINVIC